MAPSPEATSTSLDGSSRSSPASYAVAISSAVAASSSDSVSRRRISARIATRGVDRP
ncbi:MULTISPECIES: hypothetical protein [unclassified Streptomyces]|uniref:hypothetical protein n=1 Tax=unclassified Streptomyces TaxID=2593676 RepID=UPI003319F435